MNYKYLLFFVLISIASCTEHQTVTEVEHINQVITGNNPAPYSGITTTQIESYVNRIFIDLVGREPNDSELTSWTTYLKDNELAEDSRKIVVSNMQGTVDFYKRFFEIYSGQLLGGVTSQDIQDKITQYQIFKTNALLQGDTLEAQLLDYRMGLVQDVASATSDFATNSISINNFFGRLICNPIYDEINMGSENFVLASFEGLFKRYPTDVELSKSVDMVNGSPRTLLSLDGSSKEDFVHIMTTVPAFYEGLTIELYRQLLARNPSSIEMGEGTLHLTTIGSYQTLQQEVMKTDEYAGF